MTNQQLLSEASQFLGRVELGMFVTVDEAGFPHGRWMTAKAVDSIHQLVTVSADETRKTRHIMGNPSVCWIFSDPDEGEVLLLKGQANISHDAAATMSAWDHLAQVARNYAFGPLSDDEHLSLVTIETKVQYAELTSPRLELMAPIQIEL